MKIEWKNSTSRKRLSKMIAGTRRCRTAGRQAGWLFPNLPHTDRLGKANDTDDRCPREP